MENPLDTQADAPAAPALRCVPSTPDSTASLPTVSALAPQQALGHYLQTRREALEMSLEQITRTTKIPQASLCHLESGDFAKLPGDVFVRGFLRSYAQCLKVDADEVVQRYAQCGLNPAPVSSALADTLLARGKSEPKNASSGARPTRFPRATGTSASESADTVRKSKATPTQECAAHAQVSGQAQDGVVQTKQSKSESVRNVLRDAFDLRSWHRSSPKDASAVRADAAKSADKATTRSAPIETEEESTTPERQRTFIPPRLDFGEDVSRRGPLTLGVIILVIVATLTMSYLLRRPGTSVDGFTMLDSQGALLASDADDSPVGPALGPLSLG